MMEGNPLQRTPEWLHQRAGCLTASRAAAVLKRSARTGQPLQAYYDLQDTLIAERIIGDTIGIGTTPAMQWGIDHEDEARAVYEARTGELVDLAGFIPHPSIEWFGASPDGLVGDDGLIEIKCPNTTTHLRRIAAGVVPEEYKPQMLVQLLCTGRKWVDFVDYDPRLPDAYARFRFWTIRYTPTDDELDAAEALCIKFLAEVQNEYDKLVSSLDASFRTDAKEDPL